MTDNVELDVIKCYPFKELGFLKLNREYPQVAVEITPISLMKISRIAPEKISCPLIVPSGRPMSN